MEKGEIINVFYSLKKVFEILTSGQDRGAGRHASPPLTTTKELQLNLKTNNTQNSQKIELCGSQTTEDLKKPQSSRWVGGAEMQR